MAFDQGPPNAFLTIGQPLALLSATDTTQKISLLSVVPLLFPWESADIQSDSCLPLWNARPTVLRSHNPHMLKVYCLTAQHSQSVLLLHSAACFVYRLALGNHPQRRFNMTFSEMPFMTSPSSLILSFMLLLVYPLWYTPRATKSCALVCLR